MIVHKCFKKKKKDLVTQKLAILSPEVVWYFIFVLTLPWAVQSQGRGTTGKDSILQGRTLSYRDIFQAPSQGSLHLAEEADLECGDRFMCRHFSGGLGSPHIDHGL